MTPIIIYFQVEDTEQTQWELKVVVVWIDQVPFCAHANIPPRDLQSARPPYGNYQFDSENREHLNNMNIHQIMWDRKSDHLPTSSTAKSYLHCDASKTADYNHIFEGSLRVN